MPPSMPNRDNGGNLPIVTHRLIVADRRRCRVLEGKKPRQSRARNETL